MRDTGRVEVVRGASSGLWGALSCDVEIADRWREDLPGFALQHEIGRVFPPALSDVEIAAC